MRFPTFPYPIFVSLFVTIASQSMNRAGRQSMIVFLSLLWVTVTTENVNSHPYVLSLLHTIFANGDNHLWGIAHFIRDKEIFRYSSCLIWIAQAVHVVKATKQVQDSSYSDLQYSTYYPGCCKGAVSDGNPQTRRIPLPANSPTNAIPLALATYYVWQCCWTICDVMNENIAICKKEMPRQYFASLVWHMKVICIMDCIVSIAGWWNFQTHRNWVGALTMNEQIQVSNKKIFVSWLSCKTSLSHWFEL